MDRRAIIEEAAGVTRFKTKKRLSEAKLESSKLNLSRVNDIVVEVEKQLGSLKRQASKARRYAEIREQMRGIVRQMLAGKARELDAEAERLGTRLTRIDRGGNAAGAVHPRRGSGAGSSEPAHLLTGRGNPAESECARTKRRWKWTAAKTASRSTKRAAQNWPDRNEQLAAERQAVDGADSRMGSAQHRAATGGAKLSARNPSS